ncbi:hypothetical protein [Dechloromonas sp. HYN0024]|uniref:hypothetical protein n=1 Tax=Dechloromonas sp. HYN0024 TaxID=2231055 RepID=UPI000E43CFCC|nr:hypothetical protein [Dechloromonas sp. HYN0024]AXS81262.1 hypothetical protein HYN24_15215 [Dechloromonas sp. HYN0024]
MHWRGIVGALVGGLLAGCAAYDGFSLQAGGGRIEALERIMGQPAMRWNDADGGQTLVYPRGPMGFHTFFVRSDALGNFVGRENVLDTGHFSRIQVGMTQDQVLRILGPSVAEWTTYFKARDELVWEWRFCDDWNEPARFNVLFDGSSRQVRSTLSAPESSRAMSISDDRRGWCGH